MCFWLERRTNILFLPGYWHVYMICFNKCIFCVNANYFEIPQCFFFFKYKDTTTSYFLFAFIHLFSKTRSSVILKNVFFAFFSLCWVSWMALQNCVLAFLALGEMCLCVHAWHALGEQNHLYWTFWTHWLW